MRSIFALSLFMAATLLAQPTPEPKSDVSNKALITKATPVAKSGADITALRKMADDFYGWRNENFPVYSSDSGLHTWDNRLTDYSAGKISERAQHIRKLLDQVRAMPGGKWPKEDRIDWMLSGRNWKATSSAAASCSRKKPIRSSTSVNARTASFRC